MSDFFPGIFVGALFGLLVGVMAEGKFSGAWDAIYECEKDLPHRQACVLTAIPKHEAGSHE